VATRITITQTRRRTVRWFGAMSGPQTGFDAEPGSKLQGLVEVVKAKLTGSRIKKAAPVPGESAAPTTPILGPSRSRGDKK
jgi:hypothetical protein